MTHVGPSWDLWALRAGGVTGGSQLSAVSTDERRVSASSDDQPYAPVEASRQGCAEEDGPNPVVDRLEANESTGEGFAQEEQAPLRLNLAAGAHGADLDTAGIVGVGEPMGVGVRIASGNLTARNSRSIAARTSRSCGEAIPRQAQVTVRVTW